MNRCSRCDTSRQRSNLISLEDGFGITRGLICLDSSTGKIRVERRDPISEHIRKRKAASYRTAFEREIIKRMHKAAEDDLISMGPNL